MIVDFAAGARAMPELCMFAEGARFQEEISAVGPMGKIECQVPGPGRFRLDPSASTSGSSTSCAAKARLR